MKKISINAKLQKSRSTQREEMLESFWVQSFHRSFAPFARLVSNSCLNAKDLTFWFLNLQQHWSLRSKLCQTGTFYLKRTIDKEAPKAALDKFLRGVSVNVPLVAAVGCKGWTKGLCEFGTHWWALYQANLKNGRIVFATVSSKYIYTFSN